MSSNKKKGNIRDHSAETNLFLRRALFAFIVIILLLLVLLVNLADLQIANFSYYSTKSNNNRIEIIPIPPSRGMIYDRNGTPLAINNITYQLNIIPDKIKNLNEQFNQLKAIVDLTDEDIENFQKERRNYKAHRPVPLKDNLTQQQIAHFVVDQHRFPYVSIVGIQHRYYPYEASLTHIIGYISKINSQDKQRLEEENKSSNYVATFNIGKMGIEKYYEDVLHGIPGYEKVEVNSRGRIVSQLNQFPPQAGEDIYLSINLKLQLYIEKLLAGRKAAVVAIDPNNGEILALVSSPTYDSNPFVGGISSDKYKALLNDPNKPLYNRALLGSYPPASTVKPYIAIAALSEGVVTSKSVVNDPGWWQLPGTERRYRDWLKWGHGKVDVLRAIEESVDTYFYQVAYDMGIDRLNAWMTKFGFGERTGIDISTNEESRAVMPSREWKIQRHKKSWLQGDTIPVGIGQGYWTATPIQMAKALTILINNGKTYTPHFLLYKKSDIINSNEQQPIINPEKYLENNSLSDVNPSYWALAKEGMYRVMFGSRGTARKIYADAKYQAAGKSGTAQVYGLKVDEVYNAQNVPEHLRDHALFVAYAPYDKPKIALAIVLENGGGGSSNGGAVARKILDFYLLGNNSTELDESSPNTGTED
ncbi:penicillin-binding protein 2 [Gilliamella sp. B14448G11]|uniref:penicillin-binding protein 2 n=1 Tax=unclassified Gilliamella TaxID=2685620 RepID=UPI0018DE6D9F|nr:penicillin-binding protein 2 [Gilliamella sp. B14448G7]MBI0031057.1 penicillin-binding protein 2 [Gilliamella sp. B14384G15]MBI0034513.1 penicillin-binding protein 2 [Gilliamella sp. B14448G11]MBI0041557.1 penicillin-binding protein 2 [Gilliamella sp. B14448G12]MBI0058407.1 penicillin-binding protein 2 [Gilliamella sp. B14384G12]